MVALVWDPFYKLNTLIHVLLVQWTSVAIKSVSAISYSWQEAGKVKCNGLVSEESQ